MNSRLILWPLLICLSVSSGRWDTCFAGTQLDAATQKTFYHGLRDYEQWWFNRKSTLREGSRVSVWEVGPKGTVIRLMHTPASDSPIRAAQYGMVDHGQIFNIVETGPVPPNVEKPKPGVTFLSVSDVPSLMEKMIGFPRSGYLHGQPISMWVEKGELRLRRDLEHEGNGVLAVECRREGRQSLTFWFDKYNRLAGLDERFTPGNILPNGTVLPAGKSSNTLCEYYYASPEDRIPDKIVTKARDTDFTGEITAFVEQSAINESLPSRVTLPSFDVTNGMEVVCSEQPGNEFRLDDGVVVAVVDGMTLDEIESLRWKNSSGSRFTFYAFMCLLLIVAVGIIIWNRS